MRVLARDKTFEAIPASASMPTTARRPLYGRIKEMPLAPLGEMAGWDSYLEAFSR